MRTAEVQFSEIKLIWSAKCVLDGGSWTVERWTVDGAFGKRQFFFSFE